MSGSFLFMIMRAQTPFLGFIAVLIGLPLAASAKGSTYAISASGTPGAPASLVVTRGYPKADDNGTVLGYCVDQKLAQQLAEVARLDGVDWKVTKVDKTRATRGACPDLRRPKAKSPKRLMAEKKAPVDDSGATQWHTGHTHGSKATKGCYTHVLRVSHGKDALADWRQTDECEDRCGEDGQDCFTKALEHKGFVQVGSRRLVHLLKREDGHDNGSVTEGLYGYGCGEIKRVWGWQWVSPGEPTKAEITSVDGWQKLSATLTEGTDVQKTTLIWDAKDCVYRPETPAK
ncbi:MAG: hypothetical protein ACI9WU_000814 [Myxococcota bacterium]|jgi:hypothetical protein